MIDLPDLKKAANIPTANTAHDAYLQQLEIMAVDFLNTQTGRFFGEAEEVTEVLAGNATDALWLPWRASAITSVVEQPYEGGTQTTITASADDGYALRKLPGKDHGIKLVRKGGHTWLAGREYVVTFTRGYIPETEPDTARGIVTMLTLHWFEQRTPVAIGTVAPPVPLHVQQMINAIRRPRV